MRGKYSEAWAYQSFPAADAAKVLAPERARVVLFHVIASGRCWIEATGGERLWAQAGDVIVLPYNDEHRMGGTAEAAAVSVRDLIAAPPWDVMPFIQHGEGGDPTDVVCGYLACDDALFDPRLRVFPPAFVVSPTEGAARAWVSASIEYAVQRTTQVSVDRFEAPTRVSELLLIEVLKQHLATAPAADHGWLAAIKDPVIAPALAACTAHRSRSGPSTGSPSSRVCRRRCSTSGSDAVLGLAPIRYLTGWRMHVAEDLLRTTDLGVAAVARRVGYDSEEAFSRAFKRAHDAAPSVWRVRRAI